jgi:ribosomal protein S18 acetylase RimI-like enzyme
VISTLLSLGFVAEAGGRVRAFILGRVAHDRKSAAEIGTIAILGVHPDYQRRGIATRLVDALLEKFRTGEVKTVRIAHRGIDRHDKPLVDFVASIKTKS